MSWEPVRARHPLRVTSGWILLEPRVLLKGVVVRQGLHSWESQREFRDCVLTWAGSPWRMWNKTRYLFLFACAEKPWILVEFNVGGWGQGVWLEHQCLAHTVPNWDSEMTCLWWKMVMAASPWTGVQPNLQFPGLSLWMMSGVIYWTWKDHLAQPSGERDDGDFNFTWNTAWLLR